ncbi:HEAT repeat domain-containing protein [Kitasatospora sp. NPDC057015]|uniref:HEAT repeat domain-containing protein n=1 Tax=Kitasatospora sp. NPDC057015 TaxID=3346001 RepID=UPI00363217D6
MWVGLVGLVGLDAVDWASLRHNYGSAEELPGLLRRSAGPDPQDAEEAAADLLNNLYHQGGWICPAAPAALPFLLHLAAGPSVPVPSRRMVLELVWRLAAEAGRVAERFLAPDWQPAWERTLPQVLALLADPEPEIRRDAARALGACGTPGERVLPALLRCWRAETDPATRLDLVLALGDAAGREPGGAPAVEARALLRGLLHSAQAQTRLAAVHALAPTDPGLPVRHLDQLLTAVRAPDVEVWRATSAVEAGILGVQHWTAALFTGPFTAFTLGLLDDHPDAEQRAGALARAGGLLARWRSPGAALLPRLAARLDDPAPEVRFRAAELLACLGPAAAAHADRVAALLGDDSARATRGRETVAEAAVWALARMNDPRCLPELVELLAAPRSGFASASAHYPATAGLHHCVLPALDEVLGPLADHAGLLLPAIAEQLDVTRTDARTLYRLCQVLAEWGPAAAAAVPQLLGLLADDRTWAAAAEALAGIGPAGIGAHDLLAARSHDGGPQAELAAWACWKVGGDPGPALEALGGAVAGESVRHPELRMLADLGPLAARHADRLRTLAADPDAWTRVQAAHALWAATGDTAVAVPVLTTAVEGLADGTYLPVMLPALRHLVRIGSPAGPAARLLREVPTRDERLHCNGGWRGFTEDEAVRAAVGELLALVG